MHKDKNDAGDQVPLRELHKGEGGQEAGIDAVGEEPHGSHGHQRQPVDEPQQHLQRRDGAQGVRRDALGEDRVLLRRLREVVQAAR